jgi:hypothetical protein
MLHKSGNGKMRGVKEKRQVGFGGGAGSACLQVSTHGDGLRVGVVGKKNQAKGFAGPVLLKQAMDELTQPLILNAPPTLVALVLVALSKVSE